MPSTPAKTLRNAENLNDWGQTRSSRLLQSIRRDMDLKDTMFRNRRRNEEVLSIAYRDGDTLGGGYDGQMGGGPEWARVRENALNLPYRLDKWYKSQATSKKLLIKINRDAGSGQVQGGPSDPQVLPTVSVALTRIAEEAGYRREMNAVIGEVIPRGTSVMRIGYHEQEVTNQQAREVGKAVQSIIADVLGQDDLEAKEGQAHDEISAGLAQIAKDPAFLLAAGQEGVEKVLARKNSHDEMAFVDAVDHSPTNSTRLIRRRLWMQKRRVGENVGWAPWVNDVEDTPYWWERHVWTVAQVRQSPLFNDDFRANVEGYDARDVSEVFRGGKMPNNYSMGSDARAAQSEDILDDDEKQVEWFSVWYRRPDMISGGIRKIVSPEVPDEFLEADEGNPHVDENGFGLIPGFYPFTDFTPIKSSLNVPERTIGIPPMSVGMAHFEKIAEYNRLIHESKLRHSLRLYQIHPGLKDAKKILEALENGEDGFAFIADNALVDSTGKMVKGIELLHFAGNVAEVEQAKAAEISDWVMVQGMPPAILQGMGTAKTATQDTQGIAAGERESSIIISYFEEQMAKVMGGLRGLARGNLDDEDWIKLLGEESAAIMKAWQVGTTDDGDEITVTFGANAMAQEVVARKQLMEAITLIRQEVEPVSGLPLYKNTALVEELFRNLEVGAPEADDSAMRQLQQMVLILQAELKRVQEQAEEAIEDAQRDAARAKSAASGGSGPKKPAKKQAKKPTSGNKKQSRGGPNPSEGDGPTQGNINAGAKRGTG